VVLSRTHPAFLINLFKTEVPEINEGVVNIVGAAREAGSRGKIAVRSSDPDIDPIGACVGVKGNRVQSVVQELKGEKIDIIPWHIDPAKFVCNALAPAEVSRVIIDEVNHSMEVVVADDAQSIAIGRGGQNVRLASKLTGWNLDVISLTAYDNSIKKGLDSLMEMPAMTKTLADILFKEGFFAVEDLAKVSAEELAEVAGISSEDANELIEQSKQAMDTIAENKQIAEDDDVQESDEAPDAEDADPVSEPEADTKDTEKPEDTEETQKTEE
jgi:N utilization substance protein A